jgi:acetyl esterase/lipase
MTTRDYMQAVPAPGKRIAYGTDPSQFGDLRVPPGPGPHPVVVVIHGGWWRSAFDLTYAGHMAAALTGDGYATWNIEYRRIGQPGGGYPGTIEDVVAAVNALRALAPQHQLDLARIVVTGHSAGGHLAGWLASKGAHASLQHFGTAPRVVGAVPVAGALDLVRASEIPVAASTGGVPVHEFLGGTHTERGSDYALASPAALLPSGVPVIAIHGDVDDVVPVELSQRYVDAARIAGDPAELIVLPGVDHFEPFDPTTAAGKTVRSTIAGLAPRGN